MEFWTCIDSIPKFLFPPNKVALGFLSVLILPILLFNLEPVILAERGLHLQIQRHGEVCLLGRSDGELESRRSGQGRAPCSGFGRGPQIWGKIDGPGAWRTSESSVRPLARDSVCESII
jgi:hypothetical protein